MGATKRPTGVTLTGIFIYVVGFVLLNAGLGNLLASAASAVERILGTFYLLLAFAIAWVATGLLTMLQRARVQAVYLLGVVHVLVMPNLVSALLSEQLVLVVLPTLWLTLNLTVIAYLLRPTTIAQFTRKPSVDASLREPSNL